jgi:hypothetical protein
MTNDPSVRDDADLPRAAVRVPKSGKSRALYEISNHLAECAPKPAGFLESAEKRLAARSDEVMERLGIKAIDIAGGRGASAVDVTDIDLAYECVVENREPEKQAWLLGIGTLSGGAALGAGTAVAVSSTSVPGAPFWWIGVAVLALMSIVLMYRTWPRKNPK